jgi:hypothetical protein
VAPAPSPFTSDHIDKWQTSVNAVQIQTLDDFPSECENNIYEVALNSFVDQGSHFFLTATLSEPNDESDSAKCPELIAFASMYGRKVAFLIHKEKMANVQINTHFLGKALLKDIAKAENDAKAVDDKKWDLTKNSCIHYAGDISRSLKFAETLELADFLVENLLRDDGFVTIAYRNVAMGGLRVISNYINKDESFDEYVKEMVHSQLNIVDG